MSAIILDENFEKTSEAALPQSYGEINAHNLYLYVKSYQAAMRSNTANTKTRSEVRGGGKKPWNQKGRGGARAGSNRSPIWVGGGITFGPRANRNYYQKVNKKQKKLALQFALSELANAGKLFIVDSVEVASGKTKDAVSILKKLDQRDTLVVKSMLDEKSYQAFRNIQSSYLIEESELNAFLAATYRSVLMEKAVFENIVKEG